MAFTRDSNGLFKMTTAVLKGDNWIPLFDAEESLLRGDLFDLHPKRYEILANNPDRKWVRFSGSQRNSDNEWTLDVEATTANPLLRFRIRIPLASKIPLTSPQPTIAFWMRQPSVGFHWDQGPDSIYGNLGIPHNFGFPSACLWDNGRFAAVFFNMSPMRWMREDGVARFYDLRIMTRSVQDKTGLGMHFKKISGSNLPAGDLELEFFLYQTWQPTKPKGMEALDTMMRTFAPLHPSGDGFPMDFQTKTPARWERFATQVSRNIFARPDLFQELKVPWHDSPLPLVKSQPSMMVHPPTPTKVSLPAELPWDFSSVNNHLSPSLLMARLHTNSADTAYAMSKKDALPRFFDPRSNLIRHGTRQPAHVGDLEMTWQNLFFHLETIRADAASFSGAFNPAVTGNFLRATKGLQELAHKNDYIFPQWFDPYLKNAAIQNDVKKLGVIREPWQAGLYSYLMLQANEMTGDPSYLSEAKTALERLMETMTFRVTNEVYDRHYSEPGEFPITELFGNAYGIVAAHQLYTKTREPKFLQYSRDFLNSLLLVTFWYEDESDPISRELRNAGLFYPHGGAHVATPWETAEAHLMIAWVIQHDPSNPLLELLLKISDLNRRNSFYFFPATWSESIRKLDPSRQGNEDDYFPIEPFYSMEGTGGHRGPRAVYMAGLALWNYWLYEALAEAADRDIMVLNGGAMETYEHSLTGIERQFVIYNSSPQPRVSRIIFKHLTPGSYRLTSDQGEKKYSEAELKAGIEFKFHPKQSLRLTLRKEDHQSQSQKIRQQRQAAHALAYAYQVLQDKAVSVPTDQTTQWVQPFEEAWNAYLQGKFPQARSLALEIVKRHR